MQDIADLFKRLRFRKKLLGGVDERDVWKKLDEIQNEYRRLYEAREVKYRTILVMNGIDPAYMDAAENGFEAGQSSGGTDPYQLAAEGNGPAAGFTAPGNGMR